MTTAASIATVCIYCGHKEANAQTGRCLGCGRVVISPSIAAEFSHPTLDRGAGVSRHSPSGAYRGNGTNGTNGAAADPPAPAEPAPEQQREAAAELAQYLEQQPSLAFVLPDSRETTRWLATTEAVRDQLLARAEKAESQAKDLLEEAARSRQTAAAFTSLLGQLSIRGAHEASAATPPVAPAVAPNPPSPAAPTAPAKWSKYGDACLGCGKSDRPHLATGYCRSCYDRHHPKSARQPRRA